MICFITVAHVLLPFIVICSDAPIMIFRGRFRYRFLASKLADSDTDFLQANWPIPIFFPLSNQQERMKDSNTNKVVI